MVASKKSRPSVEGRDDLCCLYILINCGLLDYWVFRIDFNARGDFLGRRELYHFYYLVFIGFCFFTKAFFQELKIPLFYFFNINLRLIFVIWNSWFPFFCHVFNILYFFIFVNTSSRRTRICFGSPRPFSFCIVFPIKNCIALPFPAL